MRSVKQLYQQAPKRVRQTIAAVVGGTLLLLGLAMVVLPGPALLVIPLGLIILGAEFVWAKRFLERVKAKLPAKVRKKLQRG